MRTEDILLLRDIERTRQTVAEAVAEVTRVTREVSREVAPAVEAAQKIEQELSYFQASHFQSGPPLLPAVVSAPVAVVAPLAAVPEKKRRLLTWLGEEARALGRPFVVEILKAVWRGDLPPM